MMKIIIIYNGEKFLCSVVTFFYTITINKLLKIRGNGFNKQLTHQPQTFFFPFLLLLPHTNYEF